LNNKKLIENEINLLFKNNSNKTYSVAELSNKFKKTYKNRFFNIKVAMNK
jgi:choline kinase